MEMQAALAAVDAALAAKASAAPARASGCGRAYVALMGDKAQLKAIAAACKARGVRYLPKPHGVGGPAIYVGYDNCTGVEVGQSVAMAGALNRAGVQCYDDAVGD